LDIPSARGFKSVLRRMRDDGVCIVLSSHMVEDMGALCDTIVIVSRGRVVAQGSASTLCQQAGCATLEESFMVLSGRRDE